MLNFPLGLLQIFQMQTAGIRSLLEPEYEFEFVEGRWPHLEGNWSLHTVDFSKSNVSPPLDDLKWCCRVLGSYVYPTSSLYADILSIKIVCVMNMAC